MTNRFGALVTGFSLVLFSSSILAAELELEGKIESINKSNQSFVVRGTEFVVTPSTEYEGLRGFDDLRQGLNVEVEYLRRDGKHYATEVELEDFFRQLPESRQSGGE